MWAVSQKRIMIRYWHPCLILRLITSWSGRRHTKWVTLTKMVSRAFIFVILLYCLTTRSWWSPIILKDDLPASDTDNWKIKRDLPVSWGLIEILSHDQGGRRSHEIAQRIRQVIVLKPVVVSDIIQIPILHIIITGMGSHSWQGGHVISCLLGHVIESQSNFNLQVSFV